MPERFSIHSLTSSSIFWDSLCFFGLSVAAASIISHRQVTKSRQFTTPAFLAGIFLLVFAITFYYFTVLKTNYRDSWLLDFGQADATEYFAQANALLKDGYPYLQIGYDKVPSVYPLGYPVLMLPWLRILPQSDSILAPYRTNQTIGLLLILAVFGFYVYLRMPLAGGFGTLLLATLPGFFTYCRSSLSEISASMFVVLAFMFAYLGLTEERRWKIYLSAVLLGLSLNVRIQSLFFVPLLLAMALFPVRGMRLRAGVGRWSCASRADDSYRAGRRAEDPGRTSRRKACHRART